MRVDIIDAFINFTRQARCVEVIDIRRVGVEDVEDFEDDARLAGQPLPGLSVPQRRALRHHARIFDQRARTEMTHAQTAEHGLARLHRHPC